MAKKVLKLNAVYMALAAVSGNGLKAVVDSLDAVSSELHSLYKEVDGKFQLLPIEGMKPQVEFDRISEALRKERSDHATAKQALAPFKGLDINEVRSQLDRIPELEALAAGKVDDKKLDELAEARAKVKLGPVQRELETLKQSNTGLAEENSTLKGKERTRVIQDHVRQAATKVGIVPTALEDALLLGERMLDLDEAGTVTTKDNIGVTPGISAEVWLQEIVVKRPHWVPPTEGGGARGTHTKSFGTNPWTAENWNMSEQMKIEKADAKKAGDMARSAGTTVGGRKPPAKQR